MECLTLDGGTALYRTVGWNNILSAGLVKGPERTLAMRQIDGAYMSATCPHCEGPIVKTIKGDSNGQHERWLECAGLCRASFVPPWLEKDWADPDTEPIPEELLSRYSRTRSSPVQTVALASHSQGMAVQAVEAGTEVAREQIPYNSAGYRDASAAA